jgi:hypothetical protein
LNHLAEVGVGEIEDTEVVEATREVLFLGFEVVLLGELQVRLDIKLLGLLFVADTLLVDVA